MNEFGMKVVVKYTEKFNNREETFNNVTEIHYGFASVDDNQIAFESDIHRTGCVKQFNDIIEFEATNQDFICDNF